MQKVLNNIVVENPCRDIVQMPSLQARTQLKPYNRAEEENKSANFNLEEGVKQLLACLGNDCEFNLDELEEFNMNMDQMVRSNNINRGQNNIVSKGS